VAQQLDGIGNLPGARDDIGDDGFTRARMRLTDHRDILDVSVTAQGVLDFARKDIETRHDDDVLRAVDQRQPSVGVGDGDVAGLQPTVDQHRVRGRGVVPITREHVRTAHDELTRVAFEDRIAVAVDEPDLHARERRPDRSRSGLGHHGGRRDDR